jgi:putative phage-type endonuclease
VTELELVDVDEQRAAWLGERRSGVGASEVAALGGVPGAYGSTWSVWVDKVGLVPLDREPSPMMTAGLDLEPVIAERFRRETGLELATTNQFRRHPDAPHRLATVDRWALEGDDVLGPVELKYSAQPFDGLPEHFRWQVNWQLHVAGYEHGWLAALTFPFGRARFDVYDVDLDEVLVARMVDLVDRFWFDHVVPVKPPLEVDDSTATAEAIAAAWGHRSSVKVPTVELDDLEDVVAEYAELKAKVKALDALAGRRKSQLEARFGERALELVALDRHPSEGTIRGELAVSWRSRSRTDVDAAAVRRDHGDKYDRASTYRVLLLHGGFLP